MESTLNFIVDRINEFEVLFSIYFYVAQFTYRLVYRGIVILSSYVINMRKPLDIQEGTKDYNIFID